MTANASDAARGRRPQHEEKTRGAFLRNTDAEAPDRSAQKKGVASRRISFKTKAASASAAGRRLPGVAKTSRLSVNKVQQLANKYNQLVADENLLSEQPKMAKVVRRVNSCRTTSEDANKAAGKSKAIKADPHASPVRRKPSVRQADDRHCVKAKISYLESPKSLPGRTDEPVRALPDARVWKRSNSDGFATTASAAKPGSVKAAIEIFEKRSSLLVDGLATVRQPDEPRLAYGPESKPKVPDKNVVRTKQLVYKNGVPKLKDVSRVQNSESEVVIGRAATLPRTVSDDIKTSELKIYFETRKSLMVDGDADRIRAESESADGNQLLASKPTKSVESLSAERPGTEIETEEVDTSNTYLSVENKQIASEAEDAKVEQSDAAPVNRKNSSLQGLSISKQGPKIDTKTIYESLNIARTTHPSKLFSSKSISIECAELVRPNNSFLWRSKLSTPAPRTEAGDEARADGDFEDLYDVVEPPSARVGGNGASVTQKSEYEKIISKTDELLRAFKQAEAAKDADADSNHSYELFEYTYEKIGTDYEYVDGVYETLPVRDEDVREPNYYYEGEQNIYWTVEPNMASRRLPPRPGSPPEDDDRQESASNCYESIYGGERAARAGVARLDKAGSDNASSCGSARDSVISCDQKSNSLYGRYASDVSSDRSDDWVDVSDPEQPDGDTGFVIVRERQRTHRIGGWSDKVRSQWSRNAANPADGHSPLDPGHVYESLDDDDFDYDSFDSDSDEGPSTRTNQNDSGVDVGNGRLPSPPSNVYSLTQLKKHVMKLRPNWSIAKSFGLINAGKAGDAETSQAKRKPDVARPAPATPTPDAPKEHGSVEAKPVGPPESSPDDEVAKRNSLGRKMTWLKFRRSTSIVESASTSPLTIAKPQSTFYVTDSIDVDADAPPEQPSAKPTVPVRRKSRYATARPQSPPPPTPTDKKPPKRSATKTSSWYKEVGLFKNEPPAPLIAQPEKPTNTSWYAEIGLYQDHDRVSSTSSRENSGSGPVASEIELRNERNSRLSNGRSPDDPDEVQVRNSTYIETILGNADDLYQFYSQAAIEKDCTAGDDSDCEVGYERIGVGAVADGSPDRSPKTPTPAHRYNRSLWCEIPEVKSSGILDVLTANERRLQEAKFEIVASEVSYLKSLRVLEEHFEAGLATDDRLSPEERTVLFGRVRPVAECSERLLQDLEECWSSSVLLPGVCDVVFRHSKQYFQVYVSYCENQVFVENALRAARTRRAFTDALRQLESSPACQQLPLFSFLILPMQRITRLPLLIDAVLKRLAPDHEDRPGCERALVSLNELAGRCNEAARAAERVEEMNRVMSRLEFPPTVPPLPAETTAGPGRYLVRSGELTQLVSRGEEGQTVSKLTMARKLSRLPVHLFLFSDVLVIAKKRSDDRFGVMHHCPRNFIELAEDATGLGSPPALKDRHLLFLTLLENHDMKTIEMVLSCANETDRRRWCEAFTPARTDGEDETLYETWDCPQVATVHFYATEQPDELNLIVGDVVNVTKKMADGWYYGERIRDRQAGWFPGNHTVEIVNRHVRARNLRQRYRLLALTGSYISQARAAAADVR